MIVSTCCGAALHREPEVLRKGVAETCWNVCSACHQPNDGETIPQRDARIRLAEREACARMFVARVPGTWPDCPDDPDWETWGLRLHGDEAGDWLEGEEGRAWFLRLRALDLSDAGKP